MATNESDFLERLGRSRMQDVRRVADQLLEELSEKEIFSTE